MVFWIFIIAEHYFHGKIPYILLLLGEASYVLYLFHPLFLPIIPEFISKYLNNIPAWLSVLISIPIAFVISIFIHKIIEKPVTKWLRPKVL